APGHTRHDSGLPGWPESLTAGRVNDELLPRDSGAPSGPVALVRRVVDVLVVVLVLVVLVVLVEVRVRTPTRLVAGELALQRGEVGVGGLVLQLPGHLRLLGLSTAAPHGSTPSHRNCGAAQQGRAPTTSGISRASYGTSLEACSAPRPRRGAALCRASGGRSSRREVRVVWRLTHNTPHCPAGRA